MIARDLPEVQANLLFKMYEPYHLILSGNSEISKGKNEGQFM